MHNDPENEKPAPKRMSAKDILPLASRFALRGTMASVLLSVAYNNVYVDDHRAGALQDAGDASCTIKAPGHAATAAEVTQQCRESVRDYISTFQRHFDSRTMLFFADKNENANFDRASQYLGAPLKDIAQEEFRNRVAYDASVGRIAQAVNDITLNGSKPFANAAVGVELQSVIPVVAANGQETQNYTGKFKVVVTDSGSTAGRVFEYDHATGNAGQTMGTTAGMLSFHIDFRAHWASASASGGAVQMENTGPVACNDGEKKTACAVVAAVHDSLNSLDAGQIANLRSNIAKPGASGAEKMTATQYVHTFPVLNDGQKPFR